MSRMCPGHRTIQLLCWPELVAGRLENIIFSTYAISLGKGEAWVWGSHRLCRSGLVFLIFLVKTCSYALAVLHPYYGKVHLPIV